MENISQTVQNACSHLWEAELTTSIWTLSAIIFIVVVIAKIFAKKTSTVDVLWLILLWAILSNFGIIPEENKILEYVWELGIIFVMFALWFEEDLSNFLKWIKKSWWVAIIWAFFPFLAWYFTSIYLWYDSNSAILWWLIMTATAVSLTMMSLKNQKMSKSTAATGIMTAAVIDDVLSLIWVAIIIPFVLISSNSQNTWADINMTMTTLFIIWKVILFFIIAILLRIIIFHDRESLFLIKKYPFLKIFFKTSNKFVKFIWIKKILHSYEWEFTPVTLLALAMWMWAVAEIFGFHPAIWAYIIWLIMQKHHFAKSIKKEKDWKHIVDYSIYEQSKNVIDHVAFTIFWPIFFITLWAKIIFKEEIFLNILPWVLILFASVFILQILSASLAARFTWNYKWHESVMIWFWMLGRAELAFIVINIAFVQEKIISEEQFFILIFTTFLLNISVPLTIKWWQPYYNWDKKLKIFWIKLSK